MKIFNYYIENHLKHLKSIFGNLINHISQLLKQLLNKRKQTIKCFFNKISFIRLYVYNLQLILKLTYNFDLNFDSFIRASFKNFWMPKIFQRCGAKNNNNKKISVDANIRQFWKIKLSGFRRSNKVSFLSLTINKNTYLKVKF